ncbi:hypothetical protein ITP53_52460 [Nonomuraea sp. K274]|uniref:Uncharacterized protein n=1 Tax=Nonomuraea cypriaca TaxID=1187855 RepID=A0A931ASG3_9ACTN|nr:hypothetical protein [Nonomuraea cypriaca]MBF8194147.1 hypothetical protein [Nonomuraea cypriaca]
MISAVRDVNRVELAGECVRAALEALAVAAPGWVQQVLEVPGWAGRYELRVDSWRMPTSKTKQEELALTGLTDTRWLRPSARRSPRPGYATCPPSTRCASC